MTRQLWKAAQPRSALCASVLCLGSVLALAGCKSGDAAAPAVQITPAPPAPAPAPPPPDPPPVPPPTPPDPPAPPPDPPTPPPDPPAPPPDPPAPPPDPPPAPPDPPAPPPDPPPPSPVPPLAANPIPIVEGDRVGERYWDPRDTSVGGQGQEVEGLTCGHMAETYHVHTHVSIFLNGQQLAFPQRVGIVDLSPTRQCLYALHTHDQSGQIHVEAPAPARFTLGQLFAIWGQPLDRNDVAGFRDMPVRVYIDERGASEATEYMGELKDIELTPRRGVTIQVGTSIEEIPTYTWPGD